MAKKMKEDKVLLVAAMNYTRGGKLTKIGDFHYEDRMVAGDMIRSGVATYPTDAQRDWLNSQPKGQYNRRDMNAREP